MDSFSCITTIKRILFIIEYAKEYTPNIIQVSIVLTSANQRAHLNLQSRIFADTSKHSIIEKQDNIITVLPDSSL